MTLALGSRISAYCCLNKTPCYRILEMHFYFLLAINILHSISHAWNYIAKVL